MKLKIGAKLGVGFGIILILIVVSSVLSYVRLSAIEQKSSYITEVRVPTIEAAGYLHRLDYTGSKARHAILAGTDATRRAKAQQAFDSGWSAIDQQLTRLNELSPRWTNQANRTTWPESKKIFQKCGKCNRPPWTPRPAIAATPLFLPETSTQTKSLAFPRRNWQVSQ